MRFILLISLFTFFAIDSSAQNKTKYKATDSSLREGMREAKSAYEAYNNFTISANKQDLITGTGHASLAFENMKKYNEKSAELPEEEKKAFDIILTAMDALKYKIPYDFAGRSDEQNKKDMIRFATFVKIVKANIEVFEVQ